MLCQGLQSDRNQIPTQWLGILERILEFYLAMRSRILSM